MVLFCYSSLKTCCCVLCVPYCFVDKYEPLTWSFLWDHRDQICQKLQVRFFDKWCLGIGQWELWETESYQEGHYLGGGADIFCFCCLGSCHLFPATWSWVEDDLPAPTRSNKTTLVDHQTLRLEE